MTLKELSQVYYLNLEIKRNEEKLENLRSKAEKITASALGLPFTKNEQSKIERNAIEIADTQAELDCCIKKLKSEIKRIHNYINAIDDSRLRLIFEMRFIDCKSWNEVADFLGGNNTDDCVKKSCYRYIKSCPVCLD